MKLFEEVKPEQKIVEKPIVDNAEFIKRNLMKSVQRTGAVYNAIADWLFSFEGGITKKLFDAQMKRLDWDDEKALEQLSRAKGKRTIPLAPAPKMPKLEGTLIEKMLEEKYVAVYGRKFKPAIKELVSQLKECGTVYVLQVEELILQFKDYEHKGSSPQMIDSAIGADFLVIVDLEMPIHIEWHIHEALNRIGRKRFEAKKPIVSTWCRFNDVNDFFSHFKVYVVE